MRRFAILLLAIPLACSRKPEPQAPWFSDVAAESGISFQHFTGATGQFFMPEIMGAGCAFLDYDNDGDLDIFLVQGAPFEDPARGSGNRLYRNELIPGGTLKFIDATKTAGLEFSAYGMGAATGDFNNDGHIDLLVTNYGANVLYRNNGDRTFRNVTADNPAVVLQGMWSTGASFFDYDRDGWQDLVVLGYLDYSIKNNQRCFEPGGLPDYCAPKTYRPLWAHLFRNERGRFVEVTAKAGLDRALGRGLGVAAFDANGDGWLDLFVANDGSANHLWINQQNGSFLEKALELGVAFSDDGIAKAGMGVAVGDHDNDGDDDALVLNLAREGATLFRHDGRTGFRDISMESGLHMITLNYTGFGTGWFDFDSDGWLDLFVANGAVTLREDQRGQNYPFNEQNLLIRNPGASGGKLLEATAQAGPVLGLVEVTRGAAFGDVDNDGDVDILLTNNNGPARLLRNSLPVRNWLTVQVEGPGLGLGARIEVQPAGSKALWRRVHTDSSYLSASDSRVHFGLGDSSKIERLTIHWPGGSRQEFRDVKSRTVLRVKARH